MAGEGEVARTTVARRHLESVIDEIKLDLEDARAVRDRRGRKAPRGDVKGDMPGMVEPGRTREPDLADNLRPEVKRRAGVAPAGQRQFRPLRARLLRHGSNSGAGRAARKRITDISQPFHEAVHPTQRRLPRVARKRFRQYQRLAIAWSGLRTIWAMKRSSTMQESLVLGADIGGHPLRRMPPCWNQPCNRSWNDLHHAVQLPRRLRD